MYYKDSYGVIFGLIKVYSSSGDFLLTFLVERRITLQIYGLLLGKYGEGGNFSCISFFTIAFSSE